jgi:hypothetical protein
MRKKIGLLLFVFMLGGLILSACSYSLSPAAPAAPADGSFEATQQARIVEAVAGTATASALEAELHRLQTLAAQPTIVAGVTEIVVVITATPPPPTETPLPPTPTTPPTATAIATAQPTATATLPPPTVTPILSTATPAVPCNQAQFVKDVTISDGSIFSPGSNLTKTWRLKNTGACTWTTSYEMVFIGGSQMGAPTVIDLPGNVAPGQEFDLFVGMVAPSSSGTYRANWKLRDPSGSLFGVGKTSVAFYVEIKVAVPESKYPLDFIAAYCQAEWTSGSNTLPCPGDENDSRGFVRLVEKPKLESGYLDDETALLTHPQMITDSVIRGKYPVMRVETGHTFSAVIGCTYQASGCDVHFQLDYQIGSGSIQTLQTWHEVYDEKFSKVEVDLSALAGKDVKFILTVFSNGAATNDRALWLAPRITKK